MSIIHTAVCEKVEPLKHMHDDFNADVKQECGDHMGEAGVSG